MVSTVAFKQQNKQNTPTDLQPMQDFKQYILKVLLLQVNTLLTRSIATTLACICHCGANHRAILHHVLQFLIRQYVGQQCIQNVLVVHLLLILQISYLAKSIFLVVCSCAWIQRVHNTIQTFQTGRAYCQTYKNQNIFEDVFLFFS